MTRIALGYVRLSQFRKGDTSLAPDTQRNVIKSYADAQDIEIVGWYEDLDVSGKDADRKGLKALRKEWSSVDVVIAAKLDRWTRSVRDFSELVADAKEVGTSVVAVRDNMDTSTAFGNFAAIILAAFAEMELATITERIRAGKATSRAAGRWHGGTVPYGMKVTDKHLVPDEPAASVLRDTLRLLQGGGSLRSAAHQWNDAMPQRNGGRGWRTVSVKRALMNPRLVPDVFTATEHRWLQNRFSGGEAPSKTKHLLAGLLRCDSCGYLMHRATTGYVDVYRCSSAAVGFKCLRQMTVTAPRFEAFMGAAYLDGWGSRDELRSAPAVDLNAERMATIELESANLRAGLTTLPANEIAGVAARLETLDDEHSALAAIRTPARTIIAPTGRTLRQAWDASDTLERRRMLQEWLHGQTVTVGSAGGRGRWVPIPDRIRNPEVLQPSWADEGTSPEDVRSWLLDVWEEVS